MSREQQDLTCKSAVQAVSVGGHDGDGRLSNWLCDSLPIVAVLVNDAAQVRYMNCSARQMLGMSDMPVAVRDGYLASANKRVSSRFHDAIQIVATQGTATALRMPRLAVNGSPDGAHVNYVLSRLTCCSDRLEPHAESIVMVLVSDENGPVQATPEAIQALYGFTGAEVRLASALMRGVQVDAFAAQRNISTRTVRTQLASLFAKTGTRRQTELVIMLLRVPSSHAAIC
jgi:DNA-binding NarL/FixJ family response regulator